MQIAYSKSEVIPDDLIERELIYQHTREILLCLSAFMPQTKTSKRTVFVSVQKPLLKLFLFKMTF